jgi:hypothetical protein
MCLMLSGRLYDNLNTYHKGFQYSYVGIACIVRKPTWIFARLSCWPFQLIVELSFTGCSAVGSAYGWGP